MVVVVRMRLVVRRQLAWQQGFDGRHGEKWGGALTLAGRARVELLVLLGLRAG
jgi:hypothetical protein